jgi:hypothetical protein
MGFRQFPLRGYKAAEGGWDLACRAFNLKKMYGMVLSAYP